MKIAKGIKAVDKADTTNGEYEVVLGYGLATPPKKQRFIDACLAENPEMKDSVLFSNTTYELHAGTELIGACGIVFEMPEKSHPRGEVNECFIRCSGFHILKEYQDLGFSLTFRILMAKEVKKILMRELTSLKRNRLLGKEFKIMLSSEYNPENESTLIESLPLELEMDMVHELHKKDIKTMLKFEQKAA